MDENIASIGHPSSLFENPQAAWAVPLYGYRKEKARKEEKMMQFTPTEMATIYRQAAGMRTIEEAIKAMEDAAQEAGN